MSRLIAGVVIVFLLSLASVQATPISYTMTFTVDNVYLSYGNMYTLPDPNIPQPYWAKVGDVFYGSFTLDDAILSPDGTNISGVGMLSSFVIQMGNTIWDMNHPSYLGFQGFRDINGNFTSSPGFDVQNSQIVGLWGTVYGSNDVPWVDFFGTRFTALPQIPAVSGTLQVGSIPEPSTLLLLGTGLVGLIGYRWKRRKA